MSRFFLFFRKLSWKLTASYTLVTVAALVVIELILVGVALVAVGIAENQIPRYIARELTGTVAPQLAPYFSGQEPDVEGIEQWLRGAARNGPSAEENPRGFRIGPIDLAGDGTRVLVLDAAGQILATAGEKPVPGTISGSVEAANIPGLDEVLPRALAGESDTDRLYRRTPSGDLTVAVPVRGPDEDVRGALVFYSTWEPFSTALQGTAVAVGISIVVFTVAAGAIGTVFGFFTARGLTRRLNRVTTTAAAWGEGDFTHTIPDRSADEIGQMSRRLNDMAAHLQELIQTRQQLSVVDERNRLARDLHDSVKQQVFAISMNLGAAQALWDQDPAAARGRLDAAFDLARQSQQELATIIQTLRPVQLEGKGLRQALGEYVDRWREQTGLVAHFQARGDLSLPLQAEETLFRVAQEALANVARHSRASQAHIELAMDGGEAVLEVRDDGQGFDSQERMQGMGLRSMRERVEAAGGDLGVRSGAGGTTITARIPVAKGGQV